MSQETYECISCHARGVQLWRKIADTATPKRLLCRRCCESPGDGYMYRTIDELLRATERVAGEWMPAIPKPPEAELSRLRSQPGAPVDALGMTAADAFWTDLSTGGLPTGAREWWEALPEEPEQPTPHTFRNLTPHRITVIGSFLTPIGTPASEWYIDPDPAGPARVAVTAEPAGYHAGIPIATPSYGEVTGLPEPATETVLIVSKMVADACPERDDLVWPGDPVRDDSGRVIGCRCLHRRPLGNEDREHCAQCPAATGCDQTADQVDACASVIGQERADTDDARLCAEATPGRFSLGAPDLVPSGAARAWCNLTDADRRAAVAIIRERGLTRAAAALEELPAIVAAVHELDQAMDRASAAGCGLGCLGSREVRP